MNDLCPLLTPLAAGYNASLLAIVIALLVLSAIQKRRFPTSGEIRALALLPPAAFILTLLAPHEMLWEPLRKSIHHWIAIIAISTPLHLTLYVGLGLGLWLLLRLMKAVTLLRHYHDLKTNLAEIGEATLEGVYTIPTDARHCFSFGSLRPRIFISTGLLERISLREREVIIAHEQAHCRRRDGLWQLSLSLIYCLLPLPGASQLLDEGLEAAERACDQDAARVVGSPCDVAQALLNVSKLVAPQPGPTQLALSFSDSTSTIARRIQCLLATENTNPLPGVWAVLLFMAVLVIITAPLLHHATALFFFHKE